MARSLPIRCRSICWLGLCAKSGPLPWLGGRFGGLPERGVAFCWMGLCSSQRAGSFTRIGTTDAMAGLRRAGSRSSRPRSLHSCRKPSSQKAQVCSGCASGSPARYLRAVRPGAPGRRFSHALEGKGPRRACLPAPQRVGRCGGWPWRVPCLYGCRPGGASSSSCCL